MFLLWEKWWYYLERKSEGHVVCLLGGQPGLETKALDSSQQGPVLVLALTTSALMSYCSAR